MGEAKRRREAMTPVERLSQDISRDLFNKGLLVAGGFAAFKISILPPGTSPEVEALVQRAYFAGAQHIFHGVMGALDDDDEPTDADLRRMDLVDKELRLWVGAMSADNKIFPTKGSA